MRLAKSALRISAALVFVFLAVFAYSEYADHKTYPQVKKVCSTIQPSSSLSQVQDAAKNGNLIFALNPEGNSGKIKSSQSNLCFCLLVFENGNVTKNYGAMCTD